MDIPLKKLLRLLEPDQAADVRRSAVLVLGEVAGKDGDLGEALSRHLDDPDPSLRLEVIRSLGKLRVDQAMPRLLERIKAGGEEGEAAAEAVARLGAKGARALQELMPRVAPGLRRYIASALGAGGTSSSETAAVAMLLDRDPGVIEASVRSLAAQIPTLSASHRKELTEHLLGLLQDRKKRPPPASEAAVVRLLAVLDDPRVEEVLWERVVPPYPPDIRANALQALGKWVKAPGRERLKCLLACACDRSFRVAAPALMILQHVPVQARQLADWLVLLDAPDVAVRRFGIERVGDQDRAEVADALLRQLDHPDRKLHGEALASLARLEQGRGALVRAVLEAETGDRAWELARAGASFLRDQDPSWRDDVFAQGCKHLEAGDRRADPLWFLLRQTDPADLSDRLEKRALALRKKKAYESALHYLRLLGGDPSCGFLIRAEQACCGLKTSARDLAPDARAGDPALMQLTRLAQAYQAELLEFLEQASWLENDELYYAGFHLAEQGSPVKQLGGRVLQLVAKRAGRTRVGQAARSKLKSQGLE